MVLSIFKLHTLARLIVTSLVELCPYIALRAYIFFTRNERHLIFSCIQQFFISRQIKTFAVRHL